MAAPCKIDFRVTERSALALGPRVLAGQAGCDARLGSSVVGEDQA
jgi:hypothetical protein